MGEMSIFCEFCVKEGAARRDYLFAVGLSPGEMQIPYGNSAQKSHSNNTQLAIFALFREKTEIRC